MTRLRDLTRHRVLTRLVLLTCLAGPAGLLTSVADAAAPTAAPVITSAVASSARVALAWSPVAGATAYNVYRSTAGVWDAAPLVRISRTTYTNTGLSNGTTYGYRVAAVNKDGVGPMSGIATATPLATPGPLTAVRGDQQVLLTWPATLGATTYTLYRSNSSTLNTFVPVKSNIVAPTALDVGLTNGLKYFYRVRAEATGGVSALSGSVSAIPQIPPPSTGPSTLTATPGNARVVLTWTAVPGATSYRIFRTTTGVWETSPLATVTTLTYTNRYLVNGTPYTYRVTGRNAGGDGPPSQPATATPTAPPPAPTNVTATAGDQSITLGWSPVPDATSYSVYRGTAPGKEAATAVATGLVSPGLVDEPLANGPTYYYKVTARNAGGESPRSDEASASPEAPPAPIDPDTLSTFRFLRQSTWGPRPGDVDAVKALGAGPFIDQQFAAPLSTFPNTLFNMPVEATQERFLQMALSGPDQLRLRVAWALHKIWVVSAVEVDDASAIVTYFRLLHQGAFGNYRTLMRSIALNPAMGRYLNMLNNRSQTVTGDPPNENFPRELMQLFTLGLVRLNPNGTPMTDALGQPIPTYTENDVKELARILTGWTFGGTPAPGSPSGFTDENYRVPMQAIEAHHDQGTKTFLGHTFPAGQSASQDLDQALDLIFNHPNLGPFIGRQLIQQLVTSNPSTAYVADIGAVFSGGGGAARGDLAAVVRAILLHPEAAQSTDSSGKLSEAVLFVVSQLRGLNAAVTDHPFMTDKAEEMGQKVFYPPSVFSYVSPGYRVRGTGTPPLLGPEFQTLTSVTALVRVNFVSELLDGWFNNSVSIDYSPFTSLASDPAALVDYVNTLFMGGGMSLEERDEIISAVRATPPGNATERAKTALYLTLVAAQAQVDR